MAIGKANQVMTVSAEFPIQTIGEYQDCWVESEVCFYPEAFRVRIFRVTTKDPKVTYDLTGYLSPKMLRMVERECFDEAILTMYHVIQSNPHIT